MFFRSGRGPSRGKPRGPTFPGRFFFFSKSGRELVLTESEPGMPLTHKSRGQQCAFKNLMTHLILQFALHIAFRGVLHRCGNPEIHR